VTPDELQRQSLSVIALAIRGTPAAAKVDANQVSFELSNAWPSLVATPGCLLLQPMYNLLRNKGCSPQEAAMVSLLVARREDRLGVKVVQPAEVQALPEARRAEIMALVPKTGSSSFTNAGGGQPAFHNSGPRPLPNPKDLLAPSDPDALPAPRVSGASAVIRNVSKEHAALPTPKPRVGNATVAVAVVALVLAAALKISDMGNHSAGAAPLAAELPEVLRGYRVLQRQNGLLIYDPKTDWNLSKEAMDKACRDIETGTKALAFRHAVLCLNADPQGCGHVKAMVHPGGCLFMEQPPAGAASVLPTPAPAPAPAH
jgi:hypothetical protein